ncbi:MAG: hypothetical protein J6Q89_04835, partial [Clostridia bacterium]|nr:hypothetical protein [Clostridia bacterium]
MNKGFKRILAAFLVLCMIPAAVITAFAHGPGVAGNSTPNQSYDNAKGQFIPETIVVDGKFDDTGWAIDGWNYVTSSTGNWDVDTPASKSQELMYQYQLRADGKYFYVGAVVVLPAGISTGEFNVFLSDDMAGQYEVTTAAFKFSLANDKVEVSATDCRNDNTTVKISDNKKLDGKLVGNNKYYIEFRNDVADTYNGANEIRYFVSASITTNGTKNELFHPIYYNKTGVHSVPTSEFWPGGGNVLSCMGEKKDAYEGLVTVDGNFDEAIWADSNEVTNFKAADLVTDSGWIEVTPDNGGHWQGQSDGEIIDGFSYKYKLVSDGTKLYVAVIINGQYVKGTISPAITGTNVRFWLKTNSSYKAFTHFYDINGEAHQSRVNNSSTGNNHVAITNPSLNYNIHGEGQKTYVEFSVNLSEFNGQNGFQYFVSVSNKTNTQKGTLYSGEYAEVPWSDWDENADCEVTSINDIKVTGSFTADGSFDDQIWNNGPCDVLQNIKANVKYDQDYMYGKVSAQLKSGKTNS